MLTGSILITSSLETLLSRLPAPLPRATTFPIYSSYVLRYLNQQPQSLTQGVRVRPEGEGVDHLVLLDGACRLHVLDAVGVDAAARAHQEDARRFGLPVGGGGRISGVVAGISSGGPRCAWVFVWRWRVKGVDGACTVLAA